MTMTLTKMNNNDSINAQTNEQLKRVNKVILMEERELSSGGQEFVALLDPILHKPWIPTLHHSYIYFYYHHYCFSSSSSSIRGISGISSSCVIEVL